MKVEALTQIGGNGINPDNFPMVLLDEMVQLVNNDEEFLSKSDNQGKFFKVSVDLHRISIDRPLFYTACPECKKKV